MEVRTQMQNSTKTKEGRKPRSAEYRTLLNLKIQLTYKHTKVSNTSNATHTGKQRNGQQTMIQH